MTFSKRRPPGRPPARWRDQIERDMGVPLKEAEHQAQGIPNGEGSLVGEQRDTPSYAVKSSQVSQGLSARFAILTLMQICIVSTPPPPEFQLHGITYYKQRLNDEVVINLLCTPSYIIHDISKQFSPPLIR